MNDLKKYKVGMRAVDDNEIIFIETVFAQSEEKAMEKAERRNRLFIAIKAMERPWIRKEEK